LADLANFTAQGIDACFTNCGTGSPVIRGQRFQ
jgi:hypothetical protein